MDGGERRVGQDRSILRQYVRIRGRRAARARREITPDGLCYKKDPGLDKTPPGPYKINSYLFFRSFLPYGPGIEM